MHIYIYIYAYIYIYIYYLCLCVCVCVIIKKFSYTCQTILAQKVFNSQDFDLRIKKKKGSWEKVPMSATPMSR